MSTPPVLDALIARLEATSEGGRELDAEIRFLVDPPRYAEWSVELQAEADRRGFEVDREACGRSIPYEEFMRNPVAPPYTTSLDAALSLVPREGAWHVSIWSDGEVIVRNEAWADAGVGEGASDDSGKTPPLALCIAILRARNAVE